MTEEVFLQSQILLPDLNDINKIGSLNILPPNKIFLQNRRPGWNIQNLLISHSKNMEPDHQFSVLCN